MKPIRLLIKWSVQLDLTQILINSLAGELQKRPQILIVSAEFLASIEMEVVIAKYLSRCDGRGALKIPSFYTHYEVNVNLIRIMFGF